MCKMLVGWLAWMGILLAWSGFLTAATQQPATSPTPQNLEAATQYRAVLNRYCVTCHNDKLKTAGLTLEKIDTGKVSDGGPVWEKVIRKLRAEAMPPAGLPRPDRATYNSFATYLETALDRAAAAKPNPGRPIALHRLNRSEYANAVRDLLAVDINSASLLPADESTDGFDNNGGALTVSPLLLERYMSAAAKVSRVAVGDRSTRPAFETYTVPKALMQEDRMSEELPFGSRGGIAIHHYFPLDGEYVIRIRLQRDFRDRMRGLGEPNQLDVRLDGARIKLFTIGGERKGKSAPVFSTAQLGDPEQENYEHTADAALEVRFSAKAGRRLVGVAFVNQSAEPEGALQYVNSKPESLPHLSLFDLMEYKGGAPDVDTVAIGGPYDSKTLEETPSRQRIFVCHPAVNADEISCARKILSPLARRAYRRPVTEEDVQTLLGFFKAGRDPKNNGGGFEAGIETALERILVGPEFLFRIERDPANTAPDTAYRISDLELASRMAFFLWSSMPDDTLLDLAARGKLSDSEVLRLQVRRMLADSRSEALVTNFAAEWLGLRNLRSAKPDPDAFPDFDENLREAFQKETELFFESIAREDRSVMDLLSANYTFLNERLARHYGIPNIYGSHFRRVTLSNESNGIGALRGGLLTQGSILTETSYANRTSPTIRGKWVLENILGAPPPPPPPNVPSLKDNKEVQALTMRQRMEQHRANPACAVCHSRMDPLGFALENFDAIGRWRAAEGKSLIDSSGALPDGTKFQGSDGLRKVLLDKREEFARTVTEKLLTYALGRGLEYYDAPAVRQITREAAVSTGDPSGQPYRWSSLILGIIKSTPFQMRESEEKRVASGE